MKKILRITCLLFLSTLLLNATSFAGTAYPYPIKMNQPDGTTITIILQGDEDFSWAKTTDGYTLLYNDVGIYEYAIQNSSGNLIPSGQKANDISERSPSEVYFLTTVQKNLFFKSSQISTIKKITDLHEALRSSRAFPTTGDANLLCILIGFSDMAFTETQAHFYNLFNQVGYGTYGSVKDFYEENSYGQFHLTVDVAGPYTAANTHAYYGQNGPDPPGHKDLNVKELVEEAVDFADDDVDFSIYDNDSDGNVDGIYIVYAGYNEAEGGGADCIWYHASGITPVNKDGVNVSSYSCSAEFKSNTGSNISGIGNICHEFGHVMGAPDFYDTNYDDIGDGKFTGLGRWCTMSSGNFNGDRDCPAHYNPYIKDHYFGWSGVQYLTFQQEVTLLNSTEYNNHFYRYNTTTTDEYFLIENRQQIGFNEEIPEHGLIVYHVHKDVGSGAINITHPQKFYTVCANAGTEPSANPDDYGDISSSDTPFPGGGSKTEFTDETVPSSKSWAGANTEKDLAFITEDNTAHTIHLWFMGHDPVAEFYADVTDPCAGIVVDLIDESEYMTGPNTSWLWSFSSSVSYFGGTTAGSQNPRVIFNEGGYYTVTLTVTNDYGTDAIIKSNYIYVHTAPEVTTHPQDVAAEWGDDVSFTADANGDPAPTVQWFRSIDGGNTYHELVGETANTLALSCVTLEMSGYEYYAVFTNKCGDDWTNIATLTVSPKNVNGVVTITPNPQQYSDIVDIAIDIADGYTCGELAATGADIYIGTQYMGTAVFTISGSDLTATLANVFLLEPVPYGTEPTGQMAPGAQTVTAYLLDVNPNFSITDPTTILNILPEDARAYYTGALFASTAGVNSNESIVTLSATIKDITAVDPGSDPNAGDIRNATLTFVDRDGGIIVSDVPIGLVDPNDPTVAVGTYDWNVTISGDEQDFTIGVIVDGYYTRNSSEDDVIVTVAKPLPYFVTGGGYITLIDPEGRIAGDIGSKNNFSFNAKFNKKGTDLKGKVNAIIRRTESDGVHNYQIKSNDIKSLAVIPDNNGGATTINCNASIKDLTDPSNPICEIDDASMQINMTDNGNPGRNDLIAVTIWDKWGGLWYASNWDGTITIQQLLDGGNLAVHRDGSFKMIGAEEDDIVRSNNELFIAPNPNKGEFKLMFTPELLPQARGMVIDMKGHVLNRYPLNTNVLNINMRGSNPGIYQVIIFNGTEIYRTKVVIN